MAERGPISPGLRLDMHQLQLEARHRWLRAAEICEILRNHHMFQITSEPPNRPPSGSLFLFNRKVLRYFRKDNHNWRKKKDGKTIKEAHEKLKVGSIDVLHCYYAHGEDNENFQRRSYWLLEEDFMHIVFVHYLEVKGNKSSVRDTEYNQYTISNSPMSTSVSNSYSNQSESFSANAGSPTATSGLTAAYEDVDSGDNLQANSQFPVQFSYQHGGVVFDDDKSGVTLNSSKLPFSSPGSARNPHIVPGLRCNSIHVGEAEDNLTPQSTMHDLGSWEQVYEQCSRGSEPGLLYPLVSSSVLSSGLEFIGQENGKFGQLLDSNLYTNSVFQGPTVETNWQKNIQSELSSMDFNGNPGMEGHLNSLPSTFKQPLLGKVGSLRAEEGLQKVDSFSKWMSKELGGGELQLESPSNISWCNDAGDESSISRQLEVDSYSLSPSISQDQLFSILDFSPNRAYTDCETEVKISGIFLKSHQEIAKISWSCMFGEVEVPAEILAEGVLCCYAPPHTVGRVPFYVTCSNRLACSEVREFEFQDRQNAEVEICGSIDEQLLHRQLEMLLSQRSDKVSVPSYGDVSGKLQIINKINLLMDDELGSASWEAASGNSTPSRKTLKEKLYLWLVEKVNEDGKGPNVLDKEGQGVLHLAAALGYDWVIQPILTAGVNINFRDVNGWTALHWAAFCGRERTVALLVALGALPGALSDPSPESPLGWTPADLASTNGYKGISGFLAESSLTTHLASLKMNEQKVDVATDEAINRAVQTITERSATPSYMHDAPLKDSLAAVCNATQAADRIHQVYRMLSLQRNQMSQYGDDGSVLNDELISSLMSSRVPKAGQSREQVHSAAVQIQKKYRGWKKRKEFIDIRQRVVKIQALVRGHQVRKRYKTVIWSVGILEKVILRWRRKGTGLRGFRSGTQIKEPSTSTQTPVNDDYDYLKDGKKQTEERLQKALVRVKSMVQYPEARAQYRRLLTAVEGFQKNQEQQMYNGILYSSEGASMEGEEDDMIDVDKLLEDESFMALTFD
ncbi:hypothetical protein V2J09_003159 [Rumex salicifolius]